MHPLGWIGSACLAVCMFPQVWACIRTRSASGISAWMLGLWGTGEVCVIVYTWGDWPLLVNYGCNLLGCLVISYFKLSRGDET